MEEKKSNRGGARSGAGRKTGVKIGRIKPETISFHRRVTPEEFEFLNNALENFRAKKK